MWFFSAPKKFVGDIRQAYGGRLEYSLGFYHSDSLGKSPPVGDDIVLHSQAHGTTIVRRGVIKPWVYATNVDVELTASPEWVDGVTGEPCGEDSLRMVLSSLSSLKIRGGYYAGRETTWIKGITLRRSPMSTREQPPDLAPSLAYSTSDPDTRPIPPKARRSVAPPTADGEMRPFVLSAHVCLFPRKICMDWHEVMVKHSMDFLDHPKYVCLYVFFLLSVCMSVCLSACRYVHGNIGDLYTYYTHVCTYINISVFQRILYRTRNPRHQKP